MRIFFALREVKKTVDFTSKLFLMSQNYFKSSCLLGIINTLDQWRKPKGIYSSNKVLESARRLER